MVVLSVKPIDAETEKIAAVLSEMILTDVSKTRRFEVIGESEIGSMIGFERQKELLGCSDSGCLAEIGGALGCDYLVFGSLGRVGSQLRIDLKVADVRKNKILAREGAMAASADALVGATERSLYAALEALPGAEPASAKGSQTQPQPEPASAQAPAATPAPLPSPATEAGPSAAKEGRSLVLPIALIAGGGALALAGGGLTALTLTHKSSLTFQQANTRTTAGLVAGGAGLAIAATGIVLAIVSGPDESAPAGPALIPVAGGAVFSAAGTF
jgi:hypothetical protein